MGKRGSGRIEISTRTRRCDLHQGKAKRCTCHYGVQYARVTCNLIGRLILSTLAFCNASSTGLRLLVGILDTGCWQKRAVRYTATHTTTHACAHVRNSYRLFVSSQPAGHSISVESENPLSPFSRVVAGHRFIVRHSYGCSSSFNHRLELVILGPLATFEVLRGLVKCRSTVVVAAQSPARRSRTALRTCQVFCKQPTIVFSATSDISRTGPAGCSSSLLFSY